MNQFDGDSSAIAVTTQHERSNTYKKFRHLVIGGISLGSVRARFRLRQTDYSQITKRQIFMSPFLATEYHGTVDDDDDEM